MNVCKEIFGSNSKGQVAYLFTIKNSAGTKVILTNYGAILVGLILKNKNREMIDIVLGYDCLENYTDNHPMFGATVGRNANRIKDARFIIDNEKYILKQNRGIHNIHSDKERGFHKVLWDYEEINSNSIRFKYESLDGDTGFPGNLAMSITYTLTEGNGLIISYYGQPDRKTLINVTNHSYFNLCGHDSGEILDTEVMVDANQYTPIDEDIIPTGEIADVLGSPIDFTKPIKFRDRLKEEDFSQFKLAKGLDHNFVIKNYGLGLRFMAKASNYLSGIRMEVYSDLPGMQLYTANSLAKTKGKNGAFYDKYHGFCMEPQFFPNSIKKIFNRLYLMKMSHLGILQFTNLAL